MTREFHALGLIYLGGCPEYFEKAVKTGVTWLFDP